MKKKVTKRTARRPKPVYTAENGVKYLRAFFSITTPERETRRFWDILTALRGPDVEGDDEKMASTGIIRFEVLGKDTAVSYRHALVNPDEPIFAKFRTEHQFESVHFRGHALRAFEALGLNWDKLNEQ